MFKIISNIFTDIFVKKHIITFLFVLISLTIIFSYGFQNDSAATTNNNTIYVNVTNGNDNNTGYTEITPKHSIKDAVLAVPNKGTISIADGTYDEHSIIVNKNITIQGESQGKVVINGQSLNKIFTIQPGIK